MRPKLHCKKYIVLSLISFLATAFTSFCQDNPNTVRGVKDETGTAKPAGNTYAVVVGISHYHNIQMLHYAVADARSFKDFLVDTKLVPEQNISYLVDSTATSHQFFSELNKLLKFKVKENDKVIIYFAGHGDVENDVDLGYLLTYNCEATPYEGGDAINLKSLESYVEGFTKKNIKVILISDACRSGNLSGGKQGAELTLSALSSHFKNTTKFLSCGPGELSEEKNFPDGGHGIFTYYLLQAMYGLADENNDNIITKKEIDKYLRDKVDKATSGRQNPVTEGSANEEIVQIAPELKQAWLAKVQNASNDKAVVATRTITEKKLNLSPTDSVLVKKFYDQIRVGKLNYPAGDNAYETFLTAKKNITNAEVINSMRYDLAAELQDNVQPLLNRVIRGEFQDTPYDLYDSANKKLEIVRTALLTPDDYQYNDVKALQLYFKRAGYYDMQALKDLLLADSLHPNAPYINCEIARYYSKQVIPDTVNAFKYLRKAMTLAPKWPFPHFIEGLMYLDLNMPENAKISFEKSLQIKNDFKLGLINMGVVYNRLKDDNKEIEYYQKAVLIEKPDIPVLFSNIGLHWLDKEKYDSSLYYYRKAYALDHYDIFNLSVLIKCFMKINQKDSALFYAGKLKNTYPVSYDDYRDMAYAYQDVEDYANAMKYYKEALAIKESAEGYNNMGVAYEKLNQTDEAKKYYKKALGVNPNYPYAYSNLGYMYGKEGKYDSAVYYQRKIYQLNPTEALRVSDLISTFMNLNQKDSAMVYLDKLKSMNPSDADNILKVADAYFFDLKDYAQAINYYNKALAIKTVQRAYNNIGAANEQLGKTDEAMKYYRKALESDPAYSLSTKNLAILFKNQKNYDSSITYYRRYINLNPNNLSGVLAIAKNFSLQNKKDSALAYLKKAEGISTDDAGDLQDIGDVYRDLGEYQSAVNYYFRAIATKPYPETYNNLALTYDYMHKFNESKKYYEKAIELRPDYTLSLNNLGILFFDHSNYDSALVYFNRSMKLATPSASIYNYIGASYLDLAQYDSAIANYKRAIEKDPKNANNYINLGHSYYLSGKYVESIPYYEKTLELDPVYYVTAYSRLGYGYLQVKKYDEAIKMYQEAIKRDTAQSNQSVYYYNIACAKAVQKKTDEALNYFDKALKTGYLDLKHYSEDPDLDNIRTLPKFRQILEVYFKKEDIEKYPKLFSIN